MATTLRRLKAGYYLLAALASLSTSYYFNYLFFFLNDRFGFGDRENLAAAALHGAIYVAAAVYGGRFAERRGFYASLKIGFAGLLLCMVAGGLAQTAWMHVVLLAAYSVAVCFVWPALEALMIDHEPPARLPHVLGVFNCTWSAAIAVAYFTGGSLYGWLGVGAVFWIPAGLVLLQLAVVIRLAREAATVRIPVVARAGGPPHPDPVAFSQPVPPKTFLRLAWIANPFSYVAIYALIATMPGLAARFGLSPAQVGLFCSVWLFGRLAAFIWLWQWSGWHYRFRWLGGGFAGLTLSFVVILMAPALWMVVAAQVSFGLACGLMYSSSLFYSMDVGDAKGEHGGLHEAALGVGICAGPALGAASLYVFPESPQAGTVAVGGLLGGGFVALVSIWARARRRG